MIVVYGAAMGGMNLMIYLAMSRIPLGIAVALETGHLRKDFRSHDQDHFQHIAPEKALLLCTGTGTNSSASATSTRPPNVSPAARPRHRR